MSMAQHSETVRRLQKRRDLRWLPIAAVLGLTLGGPALGFALWRAVVG